MDRKTAEAALDTGFIHTLRDPLWKDIGLDDAFRHLYLEKNVQKLANIKQNGPACNIYPGAVHTRLNHSLGVYHVGRLIMKKLCITGNEDFTYTGKIKRYETLNEVLENFREMNELEFSIRNKTVVVSKVS